MSFAGGDKKLTVKVCEPKEDFDKFNFLKKLLYKVESNTAM